jgi:hypothetical protein
MEKTMQLSNEQKLINIVKTLPPEQVSQLVDYAQFLQMKSSQTYDSLPSVENEMEEDSADEALWDAQFADSIDILEQLAAEALAEHRAGKTVVLDPDSL